MTAAQIHSVFREACKLLTNSNLFLTFERAKQLVDEAKSDEILDRYNDLRQDYDFLLEYFVDGTEDDERKNRYEHIQQQVFLLVCDLREMLLTLSTNYEFTEKRRLPSRQLKPASEILYFIERLTQQIEFQQNNEISQQNEIINLQARKENFSSQLFAIFWLKNEFSEDEKNVFEKIISEKYNGIAEKALIVSALTLNLWRTFKEEKLFLLLDCCQNSDLIIRQRALVGLVFVLSKYNQFLPMFDSVHARLLMLIDDAHIAKALEIIILQIIGTTQTEDISRKMRDEILPEISKIIPKIRNTSDLENLVKSEDWDEENPEWQNFIDESGMTDKFEEIAALQLEGADLYMSTFAMWKNYAFFNDISNWFRPFEYNQVDILRMTAAEKPDKKSLITAMMNSSIMCNSDKYSFFLHMTQIPANQKEMLFGAINAEIGQFEEIEKDEQLLNPEKRAANLSKQYIQDLYRFFKLFMWRGDFADMFSATLFVHKTFLFSILKENNADIEINTANYFFSKNLYPQAIEMFEQIIAKNSTDFSAFQKLGFAYQKTANPKKAIDNYLKADLIQPDDSWTLKKIALCYRIQQDFENALATYQHIDFLNENAKNKFNIAGCYIEMEKYAQARAVYAELEKADNNSRLWQSITWCAFANGNLAEAEYYSGRCIDDKPAALDFLYAAHIAFCHRQFAKAIDFYLKNIENKKENIEQLIAAIYADKKFLIKNGIKNDELTYFLDALRKTIC
jgi:tetratricopeptide (TPR) repeat protein